MDLCYGCATNYRAYGHFYIKPYDCAGKDINAPPAKLYPLTSG
jgi:hypothetical protein